MNKFLIAGFLILSFASTVQADEPPWEFRFKDDGISVHTRKLASGLMEFKSDVIVSKPIDQVVAFYEDEKKTSEWYYECTHMELLKDEGPSSKIFYFVMRPPWPVSERDAVFRRVKSVDLLTGAVTFDLLSISEVLPPKKGKVRVPYLKLVWRFTPLKKGGTEVYFQQHGDAGGYIPGFIVNALVIDTPLNTLKKFRELVEKIKAKPKENYDVIIKKNITTHTAKIMVVVLILSLVVLCIWGIFKSRRFK